MLDKLIDAFLTVTITCIIVLPIYFIIHKIKKHSDKKNFIEETDEEADEFIRKLKEKNNNK